MVILTDTGQVLDVLDRFQAAGAPGGSPFRYPADGPAAGGPPSGSCPA
jgi:hypothetical protein